MGNPIRVLVLLGLLAMLGACQNRPLTPQETADQHRFQTGCRAEDAQGYEKAMPYCDHDSGSGGRMR